VTDENVPQLAPDGIPEDAISDRRSRRLASYLLIPLASVLTALILLFYVFFQTGTVNGASMEPTLLDHDYMLITRGLIAPKRGDIVTVKVIFKGVPQEWVKRIVAIGGDRVDVAGDDILVNGKPESFPHSVITSGYRTPALTVTVPRGHVFLAGDNRAVSEDSRYVGTLPVTAIVGKVVAVYAPITRIRAIAGPK
jgi:signal peptidase I